jgi:DNA-binding CsgD family transcriptional regulator
MEMTSPALTAEQRTSRNAIARICASGLPTLELLEQVARRVRAVVPYASGGWLSADPATLLKTGGIVEQVTRELHVLLFENELFCEDFAKFEQLVRGRRRAASLAIETNDELERSRRFREIYRPNGLSDELRVIFRSGSAVLGVGCITRAEGARRFDDSELAFLDAIADPVGEGMRRALVLDEIADPETRAEDVPGMIIVRDDDSIESMTDAGRHWLSEMRLDVGAELDLPSMVYQLVRRVRTRDSALARGRVRLPSGRWLFVHAARLSNPEGAAARTVVLLEPARRAELAALIVELYGLTEREREVTELLVRGLAVGEIAAALSISPHTVRDHAKAIFAKTGVVSRPELTAKFFYEHFGTLQ